jgi:SET domain-containing protein
MFRADKDDVIDASFKGNQARYLNHSCDVNIIKLSDFFSPAAVPSYLS